MQSGVKTPPHSKRSSVGVTDDGRIVVERVAMLGQWWGSPSAGLSPVNQRPGNDGVSLHAGLGQRDTRRDRHRRGHVQPFPPALPFTDRPGSSPRRNPAVRRRSHRRSGTRWSRHFGRQAGSRGSRRPESDHAPDPPTAVGRRDRRDRRRPADRQGRVPVFRRSKTSPATSFRFAIRAPASASGQTARSSSWRSTVASPATRPA